MNIKTTIVAIGIAAIVGVVAGGCSSRATSGGALLPVSTSGERAANASSYKQIELLSRPAVKEAFEAFESHDKTNRSEPYNDPTLKSQIYSFAHLFRSKQISATLQAVLYPNEMMVDLSQNVPNAAYLGVESGGATGSKFGGRGLSDDVIDLSLGAIFGNTLAALGVPDDGKEVPCLTTDSVGYDGKSTNTFPYIQGPI